jgi:hypothetical protein
LKSIAKTFADYIILKTIDFIGDEYKGILKNSSFNEAKSLEKGEVESLLENHPFFLVFANGRYYFLYSLDFLLLFHQGKSIDDFFLSCIDDLLFNSVITIRQLAEK